MKIWILLIFRLVSSLGKFVDRLEKRIERIALNPFGVTVKQYDEILGLAQKKAKIINLKIMYDCIREVLSAEEFFILAKYAQGVTGEEIGLVTGVKASLTYKRLTCAIKKCTETLRGAGYDEKRMENDYGQFSFVRSTMNLLKCKVREKNSPALDGRSAVKDEIHNYEHGQTQRNDNYDFANIRL